MDLPRSGLKLLPTDRRCAAMVTLTAMIGVTGFIVALDLAFRAQLPPDYVRLFTSPLLPRMAVMPLLAVYEEVIYRLVVMTLIAAVLSRGTGRMPPALWLATIVLAQFVNVHALVLADPLYASLRYLAVGSAWGWLYWRHGWISAALGHGGCHLLLDPVLFYALG